MAKRKDWQVSASWLADFKACTMRCYYRYILGLKPIEDTDAQRMGSNWHRLQEIIGMKPGEICPNCTPGDVTKSCPLCQETGILPENLMDAAIREINQAYETVPDYKTEEEWLVERNILIYSLSAYNWYYDDSNIEVVENEMYFDLPLINPETGRALPNVTVVGRIDKLIQYNEKLYLVQEYKSTSKPVDPDSTFWKNLRLKSQLKLYSLAVRQVFESNYKIGYGGVLADAWHRPTIRPKKLTQAESKIFLETGKYCEQKFEIGGQKNESNKLFIMVGGQKAEQTAGKKEGTFAIRETPDMFGARLLTDISERPEFYFARQEIAMTDADLKKFEWELYHIYQTARNIDKNDCWYRDDSSCEATFRCPYTKICYNGIKVDKNNVPDGFKLREEK